MEEALEVESEARVPEVVTCLFLCPFVRLSILDSRKRSGAQGQGMKFLWHERRQLALLTVWGLR